MDAEDIYCDEDSTISLSQHQGRPAQRLDSLPVTPTIFQPCDSNIPSVGKKQQGRQPQPRFDSAVPSPLSPTSKPEPQTITQRSLPRTEPADVELKLGGAVMPNRDAPGLPPMGRGANYPSADDSNPHYPSEGRRSPSSSSQPQPRGAIMPSNFPDLQFSDSEGARAKGEPMAEMISDACKLEPQESVKTCGGIPDVDPTSQFVSRRSPSFEEEEVEKTDHDKAEAFRESADFLSSVTQNSVPPNTTASQDLVELRDGKLDGPRQFVSEKWDHCSQQTLTLCTDTTTPTDTDVCVTAINEGENECNEDGEEGELPRKRHRAEFTASDWLHGAATAPNATESTEWDQLHVKATDGPSPAAPSLSGNGMEGVSSVLVSGTMPYQKPADGAVAAGNECTCASEVLDNRSSGTSAVDDGTREWALAAASTQDPLMGYDSVWPRHMNPLEGSDEENKMQTKEMTVEHNDYNVRAYENTLDLPLTSEEQHGVNISGEGVADDDKARSKSVSPTRLSRDLRLLIDAASEELHRASSRLLAGVMACQRTIAGSASDGAAPDGQSGTVHAEHTDGSESGAERGSHVARSLQQSFNRSSVALEDEEFPLSVTAVIPGGMDSLLSDSTNFRQKLSHNADRILRRLCGYDSGDVGTLPMATVVRVVCQVLTADPAPTAASRGEGKRDISWCMLSPSPDRSIKRHDDVQGHTSHTAHTPSGDMQNSPLGDAGSAPSAVHGAMWEKAMSLQKTAATEDNAMKVYVSIWRCFRECFGECYAASHLGLQDSEREACVSGTPASEATTPLTSTCFPRVRQHLSRLSQSQPSKTSQPPPLDVTVDYRVFSCSLTKLW
ncbi:unnamed protein product [Trypanosoma congolense IL3000]|uniref:WGS project CAEQ00000000 data, annotated contig 1353 n=1 Tax=Trypanosoma congolense (strain IL3000) TaxID=1068625 RepID=F9W5P1_TRYCI|nr:unnamed protein product [Trypanosoma congolense IL3000]